jgi:hypothetical protein
VRPDGSLKPHAEVIRAFAESEPVTGPSPRSVTLDISVDDYYQDPEGHARRLYESF